MVGSNRNISPFPIRKDTKLHTPSINLSQQNKGQTEANDWSEFLMMLNCNVWCRSYLALHLRQEQWRADYQAFQYLTMTSWIFSSSLKKMQLFPQQQRWISLFLLCHHPLFLSCCHLHLHLMGCYCHRICDLD